MKEKKVKFSDDVELKKMEVDWDEHRKELTDPPSMVIVVADKKETERSTMNKVFVILMIMTVIVIVAMLLGKRKIDKARSSKLPRQVAGRVEAKVLPLPEPILL